MRLAWAVALVLVPLATAQGPLAAGEIDIADARHTPHLYPQAQGMLKLGIDYACRDYDAAMENLRLVVSANATTRKGIDIPVDHASHQTLRLDKCRNVQGSDTLHVHVEITFTMPSYESEDVLDVEATLWIESDDSLASRGSGEPLTLSKAIPMTLDPADQARSAPQEVKERASSVPEESELEKFVPGPALPLFVAGLAALARTRRRH